MDDLLDDISMIKEDVVLRLEELQQMILQTPPPWTDLQAIDFKTMRDTLLEKNTEWEQELHRIKGRTDRLANDNELKAELREILREFKMNLDNRDIIRRLKYQMLNLQNHLEHARKSYPRTHSHFSGSIASSLHGSINERNRDFGDRSNLETARGSYAVQRYKSDDDVRTIAHIGSHEDLTFTPIVAPKPIKYLTTPIPTLNIAKFNGNYMDWDGFWERFKYAVHDRAYPEVEKLYALLNLLEARAKEAVAGIRLCSENYSTVVNILFDRFGRKDMIVANLQIQLRNLQTASSKPESIRMVVDQIHNICRQLENNGVDINNEPTKLDIISKLPIDEGKELYRFKTVKNASTEQLLKKMQEIAICAENMPQAIFHSQSQHSYESTNPPIDDIRNASTIWKTSSKPKSANEHQPSACYSTTPSRELQATKFQQTERSSPKCSFCKEEHYSSLCPHYTTTEARISILKRRKCCLRCCGDNHATQNCCKTDLECRKCSGPHYSFICPNSSNNSKTLLALNKSQGSLMTKKINVFAADCQTTTPAIVIFDSGAQRTFITDRFRKRMQLSKAGQETLNIEQFGGKTTSYKADLLKVCIPTADGTMDIYANSTKKIADRVSILEKKGKHSHNAFVKFQAEPDILIGMDYFCKFINKIEETNGIFTIKSIVGNIYCGEIPINNQNTLMSLALDASSTRDNPTDCKSNQKVFDKPTHQTLSLPTTVKPPTTTKQTAPIQTTTSHTTIASANTYTSPTLHPNTTQTTSTPSSTTPRIRRITQMHRDPASELQYSTSTSDRYRTHPSFMIFTAAAGEGIAKRYSTLVEPFDEFWNLWSQHHLDLLHERNSNEHKHLRLNTLVTDREVNN